ncbi:response regulator [Deinococcus yavapaiensis]|uniref:Response regulator receiver domain-containing protein n=1 Tax=Deinococcus yavapaiensis KR-236 TaxID=694435 RepID=A0A318S4T8_9DEIO|nr:response regulator [Deinococcus yavapaiensis]PYE53484.1 response regulator receiver domain-containing protein [Deinococcus yavapaiensis KR-236]
MTAPHVLLVDNDILDLELAKRILEDLEPAPCVTTADNGEEALAYLASLDRLPDLVLLDVNMPRLNGFDVLECLRRSARSAKLPIVLLSTSREERDVRRGLASGATEYRVKPSRLDALEALLQDLVTRWCRPAATLFSMPTE